MEAAPSEAPAPARPAPEAKDNEQGPLLNTLSVEATARLLAGYFHVEEDVVRRGSGTWTAPRCRSTRTTNSVRRVSRTPLCDDGCSSS